MFVAVAASLLAVTAAAGALFLGDDKPERPPALRTIDLEPCRDVEDDAARDVLHPQASRGWWTVATTRGRQCRRSANSPWSEGGFLLSNCHVVMHTVGRTYARDADVSLASLMDYLPQSNDPGCSAGFAHGLVTGVAPDIDPAKPGEAAMACEDAGTRFQRYSCVHGIGHAFMRLYADQLEPALQLCVALGADVAPDCAQGAYHDYWFAVKGADDATLREQPITDPRQLCGAQPEGFVRPCWYRAFLENRSEGFQLETPRGPGGPLRGPRRHSARGLHHGRRRDRAAGPGRPARASAPTSKRPRTPRTACAARRCRTCSTRPRATTCA